MSLLRHIQFEMNAIVTAKIIAQLTRHLPFLIFPCQDKTTLLLVSTAPLIHARKLVSFQASRYVSLPTAVQRLVATARSRQHSISCRSSADFIRWQTTWQRASIAGRDGTVGHTFTPRYRGNWTTACTLYWIESIKEVKSWPGHPNKWHHGTFI